MPPFLPRKRSISPASPRPVPVKRARLADALDAEATNNVPTLKKNRTFSVGSDDSDSDSSLSDVDSDQFEDVSTQVKSQHISNGMEDDDEDEDEDEDDEIEWEDAAAAATQSEQPVKHVPMANGPIQITLRKDEDNIIDYGTAAKAGSGKKGPSKREKAVRIMTHKLHVQFLLWHNAVRNSWIADKQLQEILVKQLPPQIMREVAKWRRASGITNNETEKTASAKGKKRKRTKQEAERNQRDWGQPSQRLEPGKPDLSHGDPLVMLLKVLSAYWKKRFAITTPGLRKRGYGTKHGLKQDIVSLRKDEHDPERHGERIQNLTEFREIAKKSEGSRDVGAQLFTALLRGLGIEARLVASLQPSGYGWTKAEQMLVKKPWRIEIEDDSEEVVESKKSTKKKNPATASRQSKSRSKVISLDTDDEANQDDNGDGGAEEDEDDDESPIDVTPLMPKQRRPKYDRDLMFPIYWAEAVSPITNKVFPVSPLVLETSVADRPEILSLFEPRGAKAEKTHQVMAYVVGYSPDGTAKDVTVRYLRKQIWPGKTKGFRIPVEKVPIYDDRGRIKRYENYDWFKHVLSFYNRSDSKRTAVDDGEDSTDLVPQQPEKKNEDDGIDTLQSLKSSADFVLERFLRREEALRPGAKSVRTFASGKGDKYKEEPVYRRADVERCLTAESWHKEGRRPKLGETPMKMVPVRAVTLTRKREAEEHERQYGEKQMQGLYSWDQTEWIIPAPIQDGIIPKNSYGNMDCFVPSMVPKGAVHVPLKGTVRICKKLEIDFAEAVTGFEFGNKRAVPVCTGVVIAQENERLLKDAWKEWNDEQRRKEETKMEKLVLDLWRKFVLGLRIRERVQDMYGEEIGIVQDTATGFSREDAIAIDDEDEKAVDTPTEEQEDEDMGGGFLLPHEEEEVPMEELIMDDQHTKPELPNEHDAQFPTPKSLTSIRANYSDLSEPESSSDSDNDIISRAKKREEIESKVTDSKEDSQDDLEEPKEEEDEDEEEEIYTPRSTRTRAKKPVPASVPPSKANLPKKTPTRRGGKVTKIAKTAVKTEHVNEDDSADDSPPASKKITRGRGRPRKSGQYSSPAIASTSTSKRSTRSRKKSTAATSPYFEH